MAKEMRTDIIRFNLKDRMRKYSGNERHFDIPQLVKVINSDKVQERVRLGDLNGFYGHHARIQFGPEPNEGGIVEGKYVHLEPCCRTVYLKAYADGTVEHQQEFFNTELGLKAWQRIQDKSGGFSSVITTKNGYGFHGFDYVNEPNFSSNRPYTLDSVQQHQDFEPEIFVLDDVQSTDREQLEYLIDSVEIYQRTNSRLIEENKMLTDSFSKLQREYNVMLDDIVILNEKLEEKERAVKEQSRFDSVTLDNAIAQANRFKTAKLEKTEDVQFEDKTFEQKRKVDRLMGRYGY